MLYNATIMDFVHTRSNCSNAFCIQRLVSYISKNRISTKSSF